MSHNDDILADVPAFDISLLQPAEKIDFAEAAILAAGGEYRPLGGTFTHCPVTHRFAPGLYIREIFMPKDFYLTTYVHKHTHPFIISLGHAVIYRENGETLEVKAPHTGITEAGTRRLLRTLADTIWTTIHHNPDNITNITDLEEYLVDHRHNEFVPNLHQLGAQS